MSRGADPLGGGVHPHGLGVGQQTAAAVEAGLVDAHVVDVGVLPVPEAGQVHLFADVGGPQHRLAHHAVGGDGDHRGGDPEAGGVEAVELVLDLSRGLAQGLCQPLGIGEGQQHTVAVVAQHPAGVHAVQQGNGGLGALISRGLLPGEAVAEGEVHIHRVGLQQDDPLVVAEGGPDHLGIVDGVGDDVPQGLLHPLQVGQVHHGLGLEHVGIGRAVLQDQIRVCQICLLGGVLRALAGLKRGLQLKAQTARALQLPLTQIHLGLGIALRQGLPVVKGVLQIVRAAPVVLAEVVHGVLVVFDGDLLVILQIAGILAETIAEAHGAVLDADGGDVQLGHVGGQREGEHCLSVELDSQQAGQSLVRERAVGQVQLDVPVRGGVGGAICFDEAAEDGGLLQHTGVIFEDVFALPGLLQEVKQVLSGVHGGMDGDQLLLHQLAPQGRAARGEDQRGLQSVAFQKGAGEGQGDGPALQDAGGEVAPVRIGGEFLHGLQAGAIAPGQNRQQLVRVLENGGVAVVEALLAHGPGGGGAEGEGVPVLRLIRFVLRGAELRAGGQEGDGQQGDKEHQVDALDAGLHAVAPHDLPILDGHDVGVVVVGDDLGGHRLRIAAGGHPDAGPLGLGDAFRLGFDAGLEALRRLGDLAVVVGLAGVGLAVALVDGAGAGVAQQTEEEAQAGGAAAAGLGVVFIIRMGAGEAVHRVGEGGALVVLLAVFVAVPDGILGVGLIVHGVAFLVLLDDDALLLAGGQHQRIQQGAQGKAVRHPGLVHIQQIAHAQGAGDGGLLGVGIEFLLEAVDVQGSVDAAPAVGARAVVVQTPDLGLHQALDHAVVEDPGGRGVGGQEGGAFSLPHKADAGQGRGLGLGLSEGVLQDPELPHVGVELRGEQMVQKLRQVAVVLAAQLLHAGLDLVEIVHIGLGVAAEGGALWLVVRDRRAEILVQGGELRALLLGQGLLRGQGFQLRHQEDQLSLGPGGPGPQAADGNGGGVLVGAGQEKIVLPEHQIVQPGGLPRALRLQQRVEGGQGLVAVVVDDEIEGLRAHVLQPRLTAVQLVGQKGAQRVQALLAAIRCVLQQTGQAGQLLQPGVVLRGVGDLIGDDPVFRGGLLIGDRLRGQGIDRAEDAHGGGGHGAPSLGLPGGDQLPEPQRFRLDLPQQGPEGLHQLRQGLAALFQGGVPPPQQLRPLFAPLPLQHPELRLPLQPGPEEAVFPAQGLQPIDPAVDLHQGHAALGGLPALIRFLPEVQGHPGGLHDLRGPADEADASGPHASQILLPLEDLRGAGIFRDRKGDGLLHIVAVRHHQGEASIAVGEASQVLAALDFVLGGAGDAAELHHGAHHGLQLLPAVFVEALEQNPAADDPGQGRLGVQPGKAVQPLPQQPAHAEIKAAAVRRLRPRVLRRLRVGGLLRRVRWGLPGGGHEAHRGLRAVVGHAYVPGVVIAGGKGGGDDGAAGISGGNHAGFPDHVDAVRVAAGPDRRAGLSDRGVQGQPLLQAQPVASHQGDGFALGLLGTLACILCHGVLLPSTFTLVGGGTERILIRNSPGS